MTDAQRNYELWDGFTGNQVMDFETEEEALTFIRGEMESDERGEVRYRFMSAWALMKVNPDGRQTKVAEGKELLDRASKAGR